MSIRKHLMILALLFLVVAVPRAMYPDLDHGDEFSDANALDAGRNFARLGFRTCRFLPVWEPGCERPTDAYTHFPPLSDIINGVERVVFHTDMLVVFRLGALACALAGIFCWYVFIRLLTRSPMLGMLAAVFYIFNPFFIFSSDSLHMLTYSDTLRALAFLLFAVYCRTRSRKVFAGLWLAYFTVALVTFDYIPYLALFFALSGFVLPELRVSRKALGILILAPVAAFGLHFLQNCWYFGSFTAAFNDLRGVAAQRIASNSEGIPLNFGTWLQLAIMYNLSQVLIFGPGLLIVSGFFATLMWQALDEPARETAGRLLRLTGLFFICGICWYVLFPAHAVGHVFVYLLVRHLVPFAAAGFTLIAGIAWLFIRGREARVFPRLLFFIVVALTAASGLLASQLPVTAPKIQAAQRFRQMVGCLSAARAVIGPRETVGINYFRFPLYRYYLARKCVRVVDAAGLAGESPAPDWFLFIPFNAPESRELYEALQKEYAPVSTCDNQDKPFLLFKRKDVQP